MLGTSLIRHGVRRSRIAGVLIEAMEPRLLLSGLTEFSTGTTQPLAVATAPDNTIWVAHDSGVAHYAADGGLIQNYDLGAGDFVTDIAVAADGNVWFVQRNFSIVSRLNPVTGHQDDVSVPVIDVNHIAIGSDGAVWYTDAGDTTIAGVESFDPSIARIDPTTLAVGAAINLGRPNTDPTAIKVSGDDIWVGLEGNQDSSGAYGNSAYVHVSISSGVVTSYDAPLAASSVSSILPLADGSLWMTLADNPNTPTIDQEGIYHVTFAGGTPDYSQNVQLDDSVAAHVPQDLVLAPSGKIYFDQTADQLVASVDPAAATLAVTPVTTATGFPAALTLGPSLAGTPNAGLWFAERDNSLLGEYDLPVTTVQPVVAAGVAQIQQVQNVALPTTRVATFTGPGVLTDYSATVNWGDGSPTVPGTVQAMAGGGFQVVAGGRVFANEGLYTVTVNITNNTTSQTAVATSQLKITDTPLTLTSFSVTPLILRITLLTATFTDDLTAVVGNFKVKINWGDGTTDSGATIKISNGSFAILDLHQFKKKGTYTVTLEVDPLSGISDPLNPILATLHVTV